MNRSDFSRLMRRVFDDEIDALREAGQAEYAGGDGAFGNFQRVGAQLGVSRERVLLVYLSKHLDGITAWANGHRSQREDVRGRVNDAIVYLFLLRGMIEEGAPKASTGEIPWAVRPGHEAHAAAGPLDDEPEGAEVMSRDRLLEWVSGLAVRQVETQSQAHELERRLGNVEAYLAQQRSGFVAEEGQGWKGQVHNGHLLAWRPSPDSFFVCRCCGQTARTIEWFSHHCVRAGEISPLIPAAGGHGSERPAEGGEEVAHG